MGREGPLRVLLTGAAGFIGSHVARVLVREGCEVHAVIRPAGDLRRIADIHSQLRIVRCDLLDPEPLEPVLASVRPDVCIHAAWYAEPGKYLNDRANLELLRASLDLACRLADLGCRRFVGIGTCFEYNTDFGHLSERTPTRPRNLYAASKLALWQLLEQLGLLTGMETAWVRLFYQYGPWEHPRRLVPSVVLSLLRGEEARTTEGRQLRDFLHVEDVAEAVRAVALSDVTGAVNVGSGEPVAVRDVVMRIGELVGRPEFVLLGAIPQGTDDPQVVVADNRLLREECGWRPRYELEEGLMHTIGWWLERLEPRAAVDL